jgi:alkylation response protein AidB-like acyl-CoA dehydrogenase
LGTRKLPTAELTLDGAPAEPVDGLEHGVRAIVPMLNLTRTWNAVSAIALMRRGIALARDYAGRREAFGRLLAEQPLHVDTLAGLDAEFQGALHLTFRVVELIGADEAGELDEAGQRLLLTLGRSLELLLLARHAAWALERGDAAPVAAAWRLATSRIDHLAPLERNGSSETSPPPPPS